MSDRPHPAGETLLAFHDGELDKAAAAEVSKHCEDCSDCRRELAELEQVGQLLASSPTPELPRTVWHRVRPGQTNERVNESKPRLGLGIAACAAGILVGVLLGPVQFEKVEAETSVAWSESANLWNSDESSSLLNVFNYTQE